MCNLLPYLQQPCDPLTELPMFFFGTIKLGGILAVAGIEKPNLLT